MMALRNLLYLAGFLSLGTLYWTAQGQESSKSSIPENGARDSAKVIGKPIGMASCAAGGCHGAPIPKSTQPLQIPDQDAWKCSFTHWLSYDKHAQAYQVLDGDLARHMMQQLSKSGYKEKASEEARCLACHTNPTLANPVEGIEERSLIDLRSQGIGCEGCHGNASSWRQTHVGWSKNEPKEKKYAEVGMVWMNDLSSRARVCAGCHVGAPPNERSPVVRNMNHDMIAAGHPRLNFEFSLYQEIETPHWNEKNRRNNEVTKIDAQQKEMLRAQSWLVGRAVQVEQAMSLLEYRSSTTLHPRDAWPEFAEFNCYGCHQDFRPALYEVQDKEKILLGKKPQAGIWKWDPIWGGSRILSDNATEDTAKKALMNVQKLMQKMSISRSAVNKTILEDRKAWTLLAAHFQDQDQLKILARIERLKDLPTVIFWDEAVQTYQGLRSLTGAKDQEGVLEKLRFPGDDKKVFNSPRDYDPKKVKETLEAYIKKIPKK